MAKSHVLNINEEDYEFALVGLSILKDQYETAISINEALLIGLELNNNFSLSLKDNKRFRFSLFSYFDKEFGIEYLLIPNASNFEMPPLPLFQKKAAIYFTIFTGSFLSGCIIFYDNFLKSLQCVHLEQDQW